MKIKVNGVELYYHKAGVGKPIILLHGNGEDHHIFDALIEKLVEHFTVYAVDTRNHGESEVTTDFTYETIRDDIFEFIKVLELEDVSIIGFSDGAIVSLLLELKYPQLLTKIALLGINLNPTDFTKNSIRLLEKEYEETKSPFIKMMLEQPNIELKRLKQIGIPTLVIGAEKDVFYRKTFVNVAKTIPNAELKIVSGHDHGSYIVGNDMLAADFIDFFE